MHSQLTRNIFRAIIRNRPYSFAECQRPARQLIPSYLTKSPFSNHYQRSLFGLALGSSKPLLDGKNNPANLEKALGMLVSLMRAKRTRTKPPPQAQVAEAFNFLFRSRLETPRRVSRNEVYLAQEAFQHLLTQAQNQDAEKNNILSEEDLDMALTALSLDAGKARFRSDVKALAYAIFEESRTRYSQRGGNEAGGTDENKSQSTGKFISILASTGGVREAHQLLLESSNLQKQPRSRWLAVLKGLVNEGLYKEFWSTFAEMQRLTGPIDPQSHEELTTFLAADDDVEGTKRMYEMDIAESQRPTLNCRIAVVEFCVRNSQLDWGSPVLNSLLLEKDKNLRRQHAILLWYAAEGKTATEIAGLMGEPLTIGSLNKLIEYAYQINDLDAVRAYLALAKQQQIRINGQTRLLQMQHELKIGDLAAAISSYELLLMEDPVSDQSDVPILNKFLAAVAFSPKPNFELVMRLVESFLERGVELETETICGLCHLFLRRDELEEIRGLLRYRIDSYPLSDRAKIGQIFREFILDSSVDDQRTWNAYDLFRHAFPETPVELRLPLMHSFFDRKRPDLACLVFGHMRQREDSINRPTAEAYAQCFEGIAKCKDVDGLRMVYNMLKMDLEVELTTRIRNGLIAAYTGCEEPFRAIIDQFWKIMDSREGPTLNSFALALRACEGWVPQGAQEARRIIALMQSWNLVITKDIDICYIGALAGQSEFENTIELIEEMETDIGEPVDAYTIAVFYNAIPWQYRKNEVEEWAKQAYPELWKEVLKFEEEIDEAWDVRYFKIDRSIDINDEPLFPAGEYNPQIAQQTQILLEASPST